MRKAPAFWYGAQPWWQVLLRPLAYVFQGVIAVRRLLYRVGVFPTHTMPVPVVVVGNITVGGTGKTPFVVWLCQQLQAAGYRPGIVSRGYGSTAPHYPYALSTDSPVSACGDEPYLLHQQTQCPVVIAPNRVAAASALLQQYDVNIVISDDGLQHYRLGRTLECVMIDGIKQLGNGWCLPAGPLREPAQRLKTVDMQICRDGTAQPNQWLATTCYGKMVYDIQTGEARSLMDFEHQTVHAVAGIGAPEHFFKALQDRGLTLITHVFADHHAYVAADFEGMTNGPILMTQKDAIKCRFLLNADCYYWPIHLNLEAGCVEALLKGLATHG